MKQVPEIVKKRVSFVHFVKLAYLSYTALIRLLNLLYQNSWLRYVPIAPASFLNELEAQNRERRRVNLFHRM